MRKFQAGDLFGMGWLILGVIHASFFLLGINGYYDFLIVFGVASLLVFPIRYWLIEKVLGMKLEGWAMWTVIGTGIAYAVAAGAFFIIQIVMICSCTNRDSNFFANLLIFAFYPVFRLSILFFQDWKIARFKNTSWLMENSFGVILIWLAMCFLDFQAPAFGSFITIAAVTISELITVHSLITIKQSEEKLKNDELDALLS